ncbi:MAG: hypothetical protein RJB01_980 [Actinomycetota bacterium]
MPHSPAPIIELEAVSVRRSERWILSNIDWSVAPGEHWVIIGPNGAGKSTMTSIASARLFPTAGTVRVLGEELGAVDLAELRPALGLVSSAEWQKLPETECVSDAIVSAGYGITGRWREEYTQEDVQRAHVLASTWGLSPFLAQHVGRLSDGEKKRVAIARALMANPEILVFDEPAAGLDLAARELLLTQLQHLTRQADSPATVIVTHHVEEIPESVTHAAILREGSLVAQGRIEETLTSEVLSHAYNYSLAVWRDGNRWNARGAA